MAVAVQPSRMTADDLFERPDDGFHAVGEPGELTGGDVLPRFRCPVRRLFPGAIHRDSSGEGVRPRNHRPGADHAPAHNRSRKSVQGRTLMPSTRRGPGSRDTIT